MSPPPSPWGQPVPPDAAVWHFVHQGQAQGPVDKMSLEAMIRGRSVHPEALVWRPGMGNWDSADLLPEFDALFRELGPGVYGGPPFAAIAKKSGGDVTTINCVALLVILVVSAPVVLAALYGERDPDGTGPLAAAGIFLGIVSFFAAVFGAFYVPIAWRHIRGKAAWVQAAGFVGIGGLLILATLMILDLAT
jgi:hypothetical protein